MTLMLSVQVSFARITNYVRNIMRQFVIPVSPASILQCIIQQQLGILHRLISTAQFFTENFAKFCVPNSASQFAKFRGLPQQNCTNSAAHHNLPFVCKLSSILFRNFSFWRAGWHSGIALKYASKVHRKLPISFFSKAQSVKLHWFIYDCAVLR